MYSCSEWTVIVGSRTDKAIEPIYDLSIPYYDDSYAADAGTLSVSRLKVYCCEILHILYLIDSDYKINHTFRDEKKLEDFLMFFVANPMPIPFPK